LYDAKTFTQMRKYEAEHARSVANPSAFWKSKAEHFLDWEQPFQSVMDGTLTDGDVTWFQGGKLNVCYNAIDRHVQSGRADQVAMIWEGDEPGDVVRFTYRDLQRKVSQISNAMLAQGVQRGDVVTIYLPMIPELPMTMLACARIGAVHSVVFAGFSAEALASRISAAESPYVVTAWQGMRGGKAIPLKKIVDEARTKEGSDNFIRKVFVFERNYDATNGDESKHELKDKDVRMDPLVALQRPYCPPASMDAEDSLFILYTSGSTGTSAIASSSGMCFFGPPSELCFHLPITGKPKGLVHTTGGYALYAAYTTKTTFDLMKGDVFACVADCGWITGHSYVVYGPLLNGGTTFVFESTPLYPDPGRYWDMIERHKITQFYTAPTAIRSLMRYSADIPARYDLSSLKVLGSVGEPINPEAWRWYYENVGNSRCTVVDTYWQTETGGHVVTNIPGVTPMKPGSCTLPLPGIDLVVLDPQNGHVLEPQEGASTIGVLAIRKPWPGMARTCLGDHQRYMAVYLKPYPGFYFTGDSVLRDKDGYHFITGRYVHSFACQNVKVDRGIGQSTHIQSCLIPQIAWTTS
jgi:acetyl-CoA synthetase